MTDITWLAELIVAVVALFLARYIIPWLKEKINEAGNKDLDFWLDFAVKAAEERYKHVANSGNVKFEYVKTFLEGQGFTYDEDIIAILIDGKVRELFNWNDSGGEIKIGGTE